MRAGGRLAPPQLCAEGGTVSRHPKLRMQRCFNCSAPIGIYSDADHDDLDHCNQAECRREAAIEAREREFERQDWECT